MESREGDETQEQEMKAASDDRMRANVNSNIKTEMETWRRSKGENRSAGGVKASGRKRVRKAAVPWCSPV